MRSRPGRGNVGRIVRRKEVETTVDVLFTFTAAGGILSALGNPTR